LRDSCCVLRGVVGEVPMIYSPDRSTINTLMGYEKNKQNILLALVEKTPGHNTIILDILLTNLYNIKIYCELIVIIGNFFALRLEPQYPN
jgi:hypothetical protein